MFLNNDLLWLNNIHVTNILCRLIDHRADEIIYPVKAITKYITAGPLNNVKVGSKLNFISWNRSIVHAGEG